MEYIGFERKRKLLELIGISTHTAKQFQRCLNY